MNKVAGMLSGSSSTDVFSSDNDPDFVGDALPFAIKLYESLLASMPEHAGLRLRTGSLYIMYANAFVQTPADMTPRREGELKEYLLARAKNLYLRGRDILFVALEKKNPADPRAAQGAEIPGSHGAVQEGGRFAPLLDGGRLGRRLFRQSLRHDPRPDASPRPRP